MTKNEKKILEAELHKLSPTAQSILKNFLVESTKRQNPIMSVENLPNEIWKDVIGYEGLYQVSNMGRVKSLNFNREQILRASPNPKGYLHLSLSKNNRKRTWRVNIIVEKAFIPNPENKPTVNHLNGNKIDNRVENLAWATNAENTEHAVKTGLIKSGAQNVLSKLSEEDRRFICENYTPYDKNFGMEGLAKMFDVIQ